jgi:hypothetical protein
MVIDSFLGFTIQIVGGSEFISLITQKVIPQESG